MKRFPVVYANYETWLRSEIALALQKQGGDAFNEHLADAAASIAAKTVLRVIEKEGMEINPPCNHQEIEAFLDGILTTAYRLDDKPHQLFTAIRHAAIEYETDIERRDEIERLCLIAYENAGGSIPPVATVKRDCPLDWVIEKFRPGSQDEPWGWPEERADMFGPDHIDNTSALLKDIATNGMRDPIQLGTDGRIWDGHHRIIVAQILSLETVPCEGAQQVFDDAEATTATPVNFVKPRSGEYCLHCSTHSDDCGTALWAQQKKCCPDCTHEARPTPERANREGDSQPMPVPNEHPDIQTAVIADMHARREVGIQRYGTALQPHNGRDAFQDAYEEALDLSVYLKQAMIEREMVPDVVFKQESVAESLKQEIRLRLENDSIIPGTPEMTLDEIDHIIDRHLS